ncbi:hypothetical protein MSMEI_0709 [Mycolicibacterium smegmatis MC2 155]|uniref:Uncharacterized protein n=1 Tax=Mycolicibacterium smegmatis (strain ATCC 700084 / mc(2)155) TaxID=246196 RepID=I7G3V7_MYCS2|nr:hypothetical protein MSMEI_0709 [Mycolicibacterium smegmatis MC2 155]
MSSESFRLLLQACLMRPPLSVIHRPRDRPSKTCRCDHQHHHCDADDHLYRCDSATRRQQQTGQRSAMHGRSLEGTATRAPHRSNGPAARRGNFGALRRLTLLLAFQRGRSCLGMSWEALEDASKTLGDSKAFGGVGALGTGWSIFNHATADAP